MFHDNLQGRVTEPWVNLRCRSRYVGVQPWVKEVFSKKFSVLNDIIWMHAALKILPCREIFWRKIILHWHRNRKSDFTMFEMTVALSVELEGSEAGVWWLLLQCSSHRMQLCYHSTRLSCSTFSIKCWLRSFFLNPRIQSKWHVNAMSSKENIHSDIIAL